MQNSAVKINGQEDLMGLMRARNVRAMEMVYEEYAAMLYGIIQQIVNDTRKAEGILLKTFTYMWNHYNNYDSSQQTICLWMITIARQLSFDSLTLQERRNIESRLLDSLKSAGVKEEMAVLELVLFQGVPVTKIAERVGCSVSDVRILLQGAVRKLKNESSLK